MAASREMREWIARLAEEKRKGDITDFGKPGNR